MLIQNSRGFWTRLFSSIFKIYLIFWPISMYSRHVYGSNIPLKYTVMLWYQQLYLRNKVSMFWACLFSKIFEPCLFSNGRLLSREYGTQKANHFVIVSFGKVSRNFGKVFTTWWGLNLIEKKSSRIAESGFR